MVQRGRTLGRARLDGNIGRYAAGKRPPAFPFPSLPSLRVSTLTFLHTHDGISATATSIQRPIPESITHHRPRLKATYAALLEDSRRGVWRGSKQGLVTRSTTPPTVRDLTGGDGSRIYMIRAAILGSAHSRDALLVLSPPLLPLPSSFYFPALRLPPAPSLLSPPPSRYAELLSMFEVGQNNHCHSLV